MATSMKDIKNRIRSVESTMQITKAMELVATSKLRHAKESLEKSKPYFNLLSEAVSEIECALRDGESKYFSSKKPTKHAYVVVAGDRGLAGGFNQNVFKSVLSAIPEDGEICILPIGKKVSEFFQHRNFKISEMGFEIAADVHIGDCLDIGKTIFEGFNKGEFDAVTVFYTQFNSMLSQTPASKQILPLSADGEKKKGSLTLYEPSLSGVLSHIIPLYISGIIYGAVSESQISEYAARRTAMNSANKNAEEMIGDLTLKFNRARQAAITQEITEIVAGAGEE